MCVCVDVVLVYWLPSKEMDTVTQLKTQDESACLLHSAKSLKKIMHPTFSPSATDK